MNTLDKTQVSERALFQRLKRHYFREDNLFLHVCPVQGRGFDQLGRYYAVDSNRLVVQAFIDLEQEAREYGVLHRNEVVAAG